jgi:hypothetical protein
MDATGRKVFMRFANPEAFFRFTAIKPVRNTYEFFLMALPHPSNFFNGVAPSVVLD